MRSALFQDKESYAEIVLIWILTIEFARVGVDETRSMQWPMMNYFLVKKGPATSVVSYIVQKWGNKLEVELCCFEVYIL
jgi:hypothetical protein